MKILMVSASLVLAIVLTMNVVASGFFDHLNQVVEAVSGIRLFAETSGDIRANKMLAKFRESKNIYRDNQSALEVAIRHSSKNFDELANEKFLSSCREWREIAFYCANRKNSKIYDERLKEWAIDSIQSGDHAFLCNMNIGESDLESSRLFKLGISLYAGAECSEKEKSRGFHFN